MSFWSSLVGHDEFSGRRSIASVTQVWRQDQGLPLANCVSFGTKDLLLVFSNLRNRLGKVWVSKYDGRRDASGSGSVEFSGCIVDELPSLATETVSSNSEWLLPLTQKICQEKRRKEGQTHLYPTMATFDLGQLFTVALTICAIMLLPPASPPAKKPATSAG